MHNAGGDVIGNCGTPLPQSVIDSIKRTGVALKGPITTLIGDGFRSVNVTLREDLDLYAKGVFVNLMSAKGRESFYKQFVFIERPDDKFGAGMTQWISN